MSQTQDPFFFFFELNYKAGFGNAIFKGKLIAYRFQARYYGLSNEIFSFVVPYRPTTGGSMNPVRTLGPAIAANNYKAIWVYLSAPILGALCGAGTYSAVKLPEEDGDNHEKRSSTMSFRR